MSIDQNKAIIRRDFAEVFNAGNLEAVDQLYSADFVHHGPPSLVSEIRGSDGVKANVALWHAAFPDLRFTLETEVAEGEMVVTHWTARGTHLGALHGIPASGRQVRVSALEMSRVAGNRIVEQWLLWDTLELLNQLDATDRAPAVSDRC
jgi:steroid delta-isomerase-like uncharacterized protein